MRLRTILAATAALPLLAACQPYDAPVRPGYNFEPQLGVPQPSGDPDDPDRASNAPAQDWSGIEGPRPAVPSR